MWPQLVTIFESPTPHKKSLLKLLFFKCSWEYLILPGAFEDNSLCKIFFLEGRGWGTSRVHYGDSKIENGTKRNGLHEKRVQSPLPHRIGLIHLYGQLFFV